MIVLDKMKMPQGFKAAGIHAGIKKIKKDMAMLYSEKECTAAGTFTTNRVKAAPVKYDISVLKAKKHGIIINSGNANACTSERGDECPSKIGPCPLRERLHFYPSPSCGQQREVCIDVP